MHMSITNNCTVIISGNTRLWSLTDSNQDTEIQTFWHFMCHKSSMSDISKSFKTAILQQIGLLESKALTTICASIATFETSILYVKTISIKYIILQPHPHPLHYSWVWNRRPPSGYFFFNLHARTFLSTVTPSPAY